MSLSAHKVSEYKLAISQVERGGRGVDFRKAQLVKRIARDAGMQAYRTMVDQLEMSEQTARAWLRRYEVLQAFPTREVWVAVGYSYLRLLLGAAEDVRQRCVGAILAARRRSTGVTSESRVRAILLAAGVIAAGTADEDVRQLDAYPLPRGEIRMLWRSAMAFRSLLETHEIPGYVPPQDVYEFVMQLTPITSGRG